MITKTVNEFLTNSLPNLNIAVIGDVMVDRYVFGDVSRISPEAPVPVNRVSSVKEVLGGAGNVASNLANLDCHVYLGAVAGVDDHGRVLDNLLSTWITRHRYIRLWQGCLYTYIVASCIQVGEHVSSTDHRRS